MAVSSVKIARLVILIQLVAANTDAVCFAQRAMDHIMDFAMAAELIQNCIICTAFLRLISKEGLPFNFTMLPLAVPVFFTADLRD